MKETMYKIIYHPEVNKVLRASLKPFTPVLSPRWMLPPSGILTIISRKDKSLRIKANQTSHLAKLLYWEGYEYFEYTAIFQKLAKKVKVFYDIGANIGYYSLLAAFENPDISVVGFEPASGPLHYFRENVLLNGFSNIQVEDLALSEKSGEITFYEIRNKKYHYLEHNLAGESNAGSKTTKLNFVTTPVKTITFNEYVATRGVKSIDLVKMDTEGTEYKILEHADLILSQMRPIVICETLYNTIEPELEAIFKKFGYIFYNHTTSGLEKVDTIVREADNGVRNCFFVPPERFSLVEEFVANQTP